MFYHSREIEIAGLPLGGASPVRLQSMTNTDTNDVEASVEQCVSMITAGAELVRLTTQGSREVQSLRLIRKALHQKEYRIPIVADVHFKPTIALEAASVADKIRINPGNYVRGASLSSLLPELLETCQKHGTAIRIGVNHGSLSKDILEEFGDSPEGMVESAMQFLRICQEEDFHRVVVSMKSSHPKVMIQSVRLLAYRMKQENMDYPIHLGVTEAGDGLDGRIKSAAGMAPLLLDGLGDTIRVSLTEAPEHELPVAQMITALFPRPDSVPQKGPLAWDPFSFRQRRKGRVVLPDFDEEGMAAFHGQEALVVEQEAGGIRELKSRLNRFCLENALRPIIYQHRSGEKDPLRFALQLAGELAYLLVDGILDGIRVENKHMEDAYIHDVLLRILQATGDRMSRTEYIACPSCGRTHFDIERRLQEIRKATSHLKPIKIGVMGCIVNGPGEMADAEYGYVGAARGKVSLYRGKDLVQANIPENEALEALIQLIKKEGDWQDPPADT
jgi:(E)-4-hydroxy-3-methylbut-2-enyl-diphosphate synthase